MIFLAMFLGLDVFLGYNYAVKIDTNFDSSVQSNIFEQLSTEKIKHPKLSDKSEEGTYYSASYSSDWLSGIVTDNNQEFSKKPDYNGLMQLSSKIIDPQVADMKENLNDFVRHYVYHGSEYYYNDVLSTKNLPVYSQKIDGRLVGDETSQLVITLKDNHVIGYTQTYIQKPLSLKDKQVTISEKQAIINLYTSSLLPSNSKIQNIKLQYCTIMDRKQQHLYVPTWIIEIKSSDGKVVLKRMNAFDGKIVKATS